MAHGIPDVTLRSRMRQSIETALILILAQSVRPAFAQLAENKTLTLAAAQKMVAAAQLEAERNHLAGVIAVVDDGGWPILVLRMDRAALLQVWSLRRERRVPRPSSRSRARRWKTLSITVSQP
jgi:hypothetical protein